MPNAMPPNAMRTVRPSVIRVRDVARNATYERGPSELMLLVPYDMFQPVGAVRKRGNLVDWLEGEVIRSGRALPGLLGDAEPGARVLLRIEPREREDEWWLCEVEAVDGIAGTSARWER
jgi:hypothetical protein